jgi:hypothetical protein
VCDPVRRPITLLRASAKRCMNDSERSNARQLWADPGRRSTSVAFPPAVNHPKGQSGRSSPIRIGAPHEGRTLATRTRFGGAPALTSGSRYASPVVVFQRSVTSAATVAAKHLYFGRGRLPNARSIQHTIAASRKFATIECQVKCRARLGPSLRQGARRTRVGPGAAPTA